MTVAQKDVKTIGYMLFRTLSCSTKNENAEVENIPPPWAFKIAFANVTERQKVVISALASKISPKMGGYNGVFSDIIVTGRGASLSGCAIWNLRSFGGEKVNE